MREKALRVHMLERPSADDLRVLREALEPRVVLTTGAVEESEGDFEVLVAGFVRHEDLAASERLHTLLVPWAGVPRKTREVLAAFGHLAVVNIHHNAAAVAEMALSLLLAASKRTLVADRQLRKGDWTMRFSGGHEALLLEGKTALVLGYGAIGRRVARLCVALGMRVWATRRRGVGPQGEREGEVMVYPATQLDALLGEANALLICLPLTAQTQGLIGARELALLPVGSVLVNVGRGAIVEEEALYDALVRGHLFGAGLDVWNQYPKDEASRTHTPPSRFDFGALEQVVMSPHRADRCDQNERLRMLHLARVLNQMARGEEVATRVDLARGY